MPTITTLEKIAKQLTKKSPAYKKAIAEFMTMAGTLESKKAKRKGPRKITGALVYEGPSMIDGAPIVGIVTYQSANGKTGNMAQLWIIRQDMKPTEAIKTGCDSAVCGNCPLRGDGTGAGRACYVNAGQAPNQVFSSYSKGNYPAVLPNLAGRMIRLGAYGDPAALPKNIVKALADSSDGFTGYSHQSKRFPWIAKYCMVSVESKKEARAQHKKGNRTFRVCQGADDTLKNEIVCPAESRGAQCIACGLCNGKSGPGKSIIIPAHGAGAVHLKSE